MKKVRELKSWISGYEQIKQSIEDLAVLFDFAKEGEATEEEVDAHYADTLELVEKLELKNMLCPENQFRRRWYGKPGLGLHADAYVYTLGRSQQL